MFLSACGAMSGGTGDGGTGGGSGGGGDPLTRSEAVDVMSGLWDDTHAHNYQKGIFDVILGRPAGNTFATASVVNCPDGGTVRATLVSGDASGSGAFSVRYTYEACAAGGVSSLRRTLNGTILWTGTGDTILRQGRGTTESSLTIAWGNAVLAAQLPSSCTIAGGAWSFDDLAQTYGLTATLVCNDGHSYACRLDTNGVCQDG